MSAAEYGREGAGVQVDSDSVSLLEGPQAIQRRSLQALWPVVTNSPSKAHLCNSSGKIATASAKSLRLPLDGPPQMSVNGAPQRLTGKGPLCSRASGTPKSERPSPVSSIKWTSLKRFGAHGRARSALHAGFEKGPSLCHLRHLGNVGRGAPRPALTMSISSVNFHCRSAQS